MKKIVLFFILLTSVIHLNAATLTDAVVDLGTILYTTATPSAWTFTVTGGTSSNTTYSGTGANYTAGSYTAFNATDLEKYTGSSKYAHVRLDTQTPDSYDDPNCGTLTITNLEAKLGYGVYANFAKKNSKPPVINGYPDGIFFPFHASVVPYAGKGTCTITKTYAIGHFAEGSSNEPPSSAYAPFNITFSVTLITQATEFSHDANAKLDFGTLCTSSQQQTLTVSPTGQATGPVCGSGTNISADSFTFRSSSANSVSVTLPASATLSNGSGGQLTVNNFTSSCVGSCALTNNQLTITVGGTLTVPVGAATGEYEGTYQVGVTY